MAKKNKSPAMELLIFLVVRTVVGVIQALPLSLARQMAVALGWFAYQIDRRHREVARVNLEHAFPELVSNPNEIDRLIRACYRHYLMIIVEMIFLPRKLHVSNWRKYATLINGNSLLKQLVTERPAIFALGHFGNWEMAGYILGMIGFKTYAIARVLDNPYLERFLKKFRQKTGQTILSKNGEFELITGVLARGGALATLADQDAGQRGLYVNFFNRPASTHKALALLAIQFEAKLYVMGIPRVREPWFYEITVEEEIDARDYRDNPHAVRLITERYTQALERLIRRHPEQYFWLHRRWKHQPIAKKTNKAA